MPLFALSKEIALFTLILNIYICHVIYIICELLHKSVIYYCLISCKSCRLKSDDLIRLLNLLIIFASSTQDFFTLSH